MTRTLKFSHRATRTAAVVAPPSVDPTTYGATNWWRVDDVVTVTTSGGKIDALANKIGSVNLVQATAGIRTTYSASDAALGGQGGSQAVGVNDRLGGSASFSPAIAFPLSFSYVCRLSGGAYAFQFNGSAGYLAVQQGGGTWQLECSNSGTIVSPSIADVNGTTRSYVVTIAANGDIVMYRNGASVASGNNAKIPADFTSIYAAFGYEGSSAALGSYGELAIYPSVLSGAAVLDLHTNYFAPYYNL